MNIGFQNRKNMPVYLYHAFLLKVCPGGPNSKESAYNAGDLGSIPGLERFPGGGHGNPLQLFLPGESAWTEPFLTHWKHFVMEKLTI